MSWRAAAEQANLLHAMAEQQKRVAERLARLREQHALTQEDAAGKAGVNLRAWQRWETGETTPYKRNIEKIARAFGIPPSDFFEPGVEATDDRLDRIESMLAELLSRLPTQPEVVGDRPPAKAAGRRVPRPPQAGRRRSA